MRKKVKPPKANPIKIRNVKTGEVFETKMDPDIFQVVTENRTIEVTDRDGNIRAFRRGFLELEKQ